MTLPTRWQARLIWLALTGLAIATLVALGVALLWGLGRVVEALGPVLWPLAIAAIIACLLDPAVDLIERKGMPRPRAIVAVFATTLLIVAALFGSIVPQLVRETRQLANQVPDYASRLGQPLELWVSHPPPWVQKLLEREFTPAETSRRAAATNGSAPALLTNAPLATSPADRTAEKGFFGGSLDQAKLETAAGWLA